MIIILHHDVGAKQLAMVREGLSAFLKHLLCLDG